MCNNRIDEDTEPELPKHFEFEKPREMKISRTRSRARDHQAWFPRLAVLLVSGENGARRSCIATSRANIDHYLGILSGTDLTSQNREMVIKLLIGEEDRFSHDLEELAFAEERAARSRDRVTYFRRLRDGFPDGSTDRAQAEKVLANFEATHQLVVQFCHRIREKVKSRGI